MWIVHYSEIGLKKKNRGWFEQKLKKNIEEQTGFKVKRYTGRFIVKGDLMDKINKIPGIAFGAPIYGIFDSPAKIAENLNLLPNIERIRIKTQRGSKDWPQNSLAISQTVFEFLKKKKNDLKLDFHQPQFDIYIEYFDKKFWVYFEKFKGIGGLPVGVSGKGLVLLSCGYDSPVASFLMQKRGMELSFIHFYAYPQTNIIEKEAAIQIFKTLAQYQPKAVLYLVNILEFQKYIFNQVPQRYLTLFYRRAMLHIAQKIAEQQKIKVLITGDSLGQVASQTIENLYAVSFDLKLLVLRPLIGFNKEEIIKLAYQIGTGQISEKNFQDCCLLFNPHHPVTRSSPEEILIIHQKLNQWDEYIRRSLENIEVYHCPGQ